MSSNVAAIIAGTVALIALFLILSRNTGSGANAFVDVFGAIGKQFTNAVTVLQGRDVTG